MSSSGLYSYYFKYYCCGVRAKENFFIRTKPPHYHFAPKKAPNEQNPSVKLKYNRKYTLQVSKYTSTLYLYHPATPALLTRKSNKSGSSTPGQINLIRQNSPPAAPLLPFPRQFSQSSHNKKNSVHPIKNFPTSPKTLNRKKASSRVFYYLISPGARALRGA